MPVVAVAVYGPPWRCNDASRAGDDLRKEAASDDDELRCVDSDKRGSIGLWRVIGDLVGFTLMELVSPVAGLAVFVVTFCAAALGVACDLAGYGMSALNGTARKTKR